MESRLIVVDGYNLIHRTPALKPGPGRTLEEARRKLINLLSWAFGSGDARFLVVYDGAGEHGRDESSGRVEVRYSRPPETADDAIRRIVEKEVGRVDRLTVVTADLEVARHARTMGADVAISDLFLASALGPRSSTDEEKPTSLSRAELEEWAKIFRMRPSDPEEPS
jgi:predicted RNA-binding protein with PIN domain